MATNADFETRPVSEEVWNRMKELRRERYKLSLKAQAEGGLCLFTLGLAGNAVPFARGVEPCRQLGTALAGEALRRLQFVSTTDSGTLKAVKHRIVFPTRKASSPEADNEPVTTEIQALRLGEIYILGLPGEILIEVGLEIKRKAALENLFIVTISNDSIGYVCHSRAYDQGGYEPVSGTNLAKGAGEILVKESLGLLEKLK